MTRKSMLNVLRAVLKLLQKDKELSVKAISDEIGSQWETTIKALEFLEEFGLVKQRKGNESYRTERLFSLK
ncbi:MAG TPA: hypothetical protein VHA12_04205 [Candidatus Nanoarchaeia archaeon]|nr:hypothetical protein [Candidatus Nanoarchaeia archaeon]